MKKGTHIWYRGQVWIVVDCYKIGKEIVYEIENIIEEFISRIITENFNLPINNPNYAKILWTP